MIINSRDSRLNLLASLLLACSVTACSNDAASTPQADTSSNNSTENQAGNQAASQQEGQQNKPLDTDAATAVPNSGDAMSAPGVPRTTDAPSINIPFEKFVLDNGLTLIVHEDHKAPLVAVNVWYHVGSKNELPGKTGFAHLFEHLMFNGSENYNDEYFGPFEKVGATGMNGTTSRDRTNYFETVPKNALDLALWMESDRMGHLLGAVDQDKLDEQRGVVQNEKRQGENQPYGKVWELVSHNSYPPGHPYSWTTIGSMDDLNAASLDDVHLWFKNYYGAANATIVIAGDVDTQTVKRKVEQYFGSFDAGPVVTQPAKWVAKRHEDKRLVTQDRVAQARIYKIWNTPGWGSATSDYLDLAADVLTAGKNSPMYQRLVYEEQIATNVSAYVMDGELGSQFWLVATAKPGIPLSQVETAMDDVLADFLKNGPTTAELLRVRTQLYAGFVRGIQRIGGFGGKANILARSEVYGGQPDAWQASVNRVNAASAADITAAANTWLSEGALVLEVHPQTEFSAATQDADRSQLPATGTAPDLALPDIQRFTLSNGLQVVLAEQHTAPLVEFRLLFDAGYAADTTPGVASMTMSMLDEGAAGKTALELAAALDDLGANLAAGADLDTASVSLSTLTEQLEPALGLMANVVLNPEFPATELDRLKQRRLASIAQEKTQPVGIILRQLPPLLYGDNHAYSQPLTGSGTEASVNAMTRDDLLAYHRTWLRPDNATLLVVGDVQQAALQTLLEAQFGAWQAPSQSLPRKNLADVPLKPGKIYLIDKPGAQQSTIIAGHIAPRPDPQQDIRIDAMNRILGGMFTSRLNMNLREDKNWSYGARTILTSAKGPRLFIAYAPVETPQTVPSMREILREMREYQGSQPATTIELDKAQKAMTLKLPGENETLSEVAGTLSDMLIYNRPNDYYSQYVSSVNALQTNDLHEAAQQLIQPDQLVWLIVGDLTQIETPVREAELGPVEILSQ